MKTHRDGFHISSRRCMLYFVEMFDQAGVIEAIRPETCEKETKNVEQGERTY